ncbi:dephospho-CoA kinase [Gillisia sp. M10.2A]|uniref:Dephospho-CoA kinase n=1 Tax=Gillisia lutea TaxID=2909668 RepID=A0ABS9EDH9_9FLAO|nr:dephospho-CoA kinase [Gillisia lutea]MCF4100939.1 dephospho-CoA kinase [Gillisia lutea]
MRVVGLTGGIGSGKTTVAHMFRDLGVPLYIADDAGKAIMNRSPEVREQLIQLFGEEAYLDDDLNRKYIAGKVFNTPSLLQKLNAIVHPAVAKDFEEWKQRQTAAYVLYEAAILFESGGHKKCDEVILVTSPYQLRISRLQKRDGSSLEEIEARMQHQWPDSRKRELATFELININLDDTKEQVRNLHEILLKADKV